MSAVPAAALSIAAGVVCFVLVTRYANGLRLGEERATAGGLFSGGVVGLATADALSKDIGGWWADRPMLGAAITGALLLGLTVLLIDAIVDRSRARQWSRTLLAPIWRMLRILATSDLSKARAALQKVRWRSGDPPQPWTDHTDEGLRSLADAAGEVRAVVGEIQPALLTGGLHSIYGATVVVVDACDMAIRSVEAFRGNVTAGDRELIERGPPYGESESRVGYVQALWEGVRRGYDAIVDSLDGLSTVAHRELEELLPEPRLGMPRRLPEDDTPDDARVIR